MLLLCLGCLLPACRTEKGEVLSPAVVYDLPCRIVCGNPQPDSLPVLPDELQNQLYRYLKHVYGTDATLKGPLPDCWLLEAAIESPSPDYYVWVACGMGESQYKMLLTVNVPEDPQQVPTLVSALPVAYSYAVEEPHSIESEEWYAEITADYSVNVHKKYEVLHSLEDTLATGHDNRETEVCDSYRLRLADGCFVYQEPEYNEQYRAVIQFMDTVGNSFTADSLWLANAMTMQEALEPENIYFMELFDHFRQVMVTNYLGELVDEVDLSDFLKTYSRGYIILEKGKKPRYLRYCPALEALEKIFGLWGLEYTSTDEDDISCDS